MALDDLNLDDADLLPPPKAPAPQPQPRTATGQYAPNGDTVAPRPGAAQEPAAPQHNPYMLARARQYGIRTDNLTPEALADVLMDVDAREDARRRQEAEAAARKPQPVAEPVIDWGEDDAGAKLTEEQAAKFYPRPMFNAIKNQAKLEAENKRLQETLEQDRQQRAGERNTAQLLRVLKSRPDLFGDDPENAQEGTVERNRAEALFNHLKALVASGRASTIARDGQQWLAMFGAAPEPQNAGGTKPQQRARTPAATDAYRRAESARPNGRHGTEPVDRRAALIEIEKQRQQEEHGSTVVVEGDYDDDLLPPRG